MWYKKNNHLKFKLKKIFVTLCPISEKVVELRSNLKLGLSFLAPLQAASLSKIR